MTQDEIDLQVGKAVRELDGLIQLRVLIEYKITSFSRSLQAVSKSLDKFIELCNMKDIEGINKLWSEVDCTSELEDSLNEFKRVVVESVRLQDYLYSVAGRAFDEVGLGR